MPPASQPTPVGTPRFELLEPLGSGGIGRVYRARDRKLRRVVAVKWIAGGFGEAERAQIEAEARAAAAVQHSGIATVFDLVEDGDRLALVVEYVDGETLADRFARGGPLEVPEVVRLGRRLAEALAAAHSQGVVHGDLSSANVMLTTEGRPKILDFGLARRREGSPAPEGVAGTPPYLAPEVLRGAPADQGSDLFSLGVVLYEALAGERPFGGHGTDGLRGALYGEPPPLGRVRGDVPLELEGCLRRLLAKEPDARPSAAELAAELRRLEGVVREEPKVSAPAAAAPSAPAAETVIGPARGADRWRRWLGRRVGRGAVAARRLPPEAAGIAFRGLRPFQEADHRRFFGRERELAALVERVLAVESGRLVVLYGDSGTGKTSLLAAGLVPRLRDEGILPITCRSYREPSTLLREACARHTGIEAAAGEATIDYLDRLTKDLGCRLVVVWDQLEELFVHCWTAAERAPFVELVTGCLERNDLRIGFVLALRRDFLSLVGDLFDGKVREPLAAGRRYHLQRLDEAAAREVIERSAAAGGLGLEPGMAKLVARELAHEGAVLPSELQIVGEQLQAKRILTRQDYRRAGGKEGLVHRHLEEVVAEGDRQATHRVLQSLISAERTRLALPRREIARRAGRDEGTVGRILERFVGAGLIHQLQQEEPWRYELVHEYLIPQVEAITGATRDRRQRADEALRKALSEAAVDPRATISAGKLWLVYRHATVELGSREGKLLRRSLRRAALAGAGLALLIALVATLGAAYASWETVWEGERLVAGHVAAAKRAAFSPDGRWLFTSDEAGRVLVWDFASRTVRQELTGHRGQVNALAVSPDGRWLVSGDERGVALVWDAPTLAEAHRLTFPKPVWAAAFDPGGGTLALALEGEVVLLATGSWAETGRMSGTINPEAAFVFAVDGKRLFGSGTCWDVRTGKPERDARLDATGLALSPDGAQLGGVDSAGHVPFIDPHTLEPLATSNGHRDHGRGAAFSPDGRLLATAAEDVVLWDAVSHEKLQRFEYSAIAWSVAFSPDGRFLVSTHGDGAVLVWDVAERERLANLGGHLGAVYELAFSADGSRLASAGEDRSVIVWDAATGRKRAVFQGHPSRVNGLDLAADGRWAASCSQDGTVIVWDLATLKPRWRRQDENNHYACYRVAISPGGEWVASSYGLHRSADGLAEPLVSGVAYGLRFTPEGRRLVVATDAGLLAVFALPSRRLVEQEVFRQGIGDVALAADGRALLVGTTPGEVWLWDLEPLKPRVLLGHHDARLQSVALSADGRWAASAGDDRVIKIWDVRGEDLAQTLLFATPVRAVAFSPDGSRLAAGLHDGSIYLYQPRERVWGRDVDRLWGSWLGTPAASMVEAPAPGTTPPRPPDDSPSGT